MSKTKVAAEKKDDKAKLGVPMAAFTIKTSGEIVTIIRIAECIGWRWDSQETGNTYGDYVRHEPFVEPNIQRTLKRLMRQEQKEKDPEKKKELIDQINENSELHRKLSEKDMEDVLSVLTEQADLTIASVKEQVAKQVKK